MMLPNHIMLITASQTDKGRMKPDDIALVDRQARLLSTSHKPSMETGMHLAIYRKRPDVHCIVHAHPPLATAFAAAHQNVNTALTGEGRALLGETVVAPYALMGSATLAKNASEAATQTNAVLLANHGAITLGKNLMEAFERMEVLENHARMELACYRLGGPKVLDDNALQAIDHLM